MHLIPKFDPYVASYFRWLFLFSLASNILLLAPSLHTVQVYDRVLQSGSLPTLGYLTLIMLLALLLSGFADYFRKQLAFRLSNRYTVESYDKLLTVLARPGSRDIEPNNIVRDFGVARNFFSSRTLIGVFDLPFSLVFLLVLFALNVWLGLLVGLAFFGLIALALINRRITDSAREASRVAENDALGFASASLRKTEEIQSMGMLTRLQERWALKLLAAMDASDASGKLTAGFSSASSLLRQVLQILVISAGAFLVLSGHMSGGMLFAASLIANRVLSPLDRVIGGWDGMMRAIQAYDVVRGVLAGADRQKMRSRLPPPRGSISVADLGYAVKTSRGAKSLVAALSFRIDPGEVVVAVGPSGSGKSTLARLLAGAIDPTSGVVRLDGASRDQWSAAQWGEAIGYVAQDIEFFPLTVSENIARLAYGFDESQLLSATRLAGVHDMITSMPDGYATKLGAGAYRLSGGQTQKLALARALFGDPVFLVLDEPDAHLDEADLKKFIRIIQKLKKSGKAIFIVSHRAPIQEIADRVIRLENGAIAQAAPAPAEPAADTRRRRKIVADEAEKAFDPRTVAAG